jgi:site-specific DNA-methyltransferase (adenine-specific)
MIELIQADALVWTDEQSAKVPRFDLVVTDPPYDSLLRHNNGSQARMGLTRGEDPTTSDKFFPTIGRVEMWDILFRLDAVTKENSITYIFCDGIYQPIIMNWVRESGEFSWSYSKTLVWDKLAPGMGYHWRARHEYIVMLQKGRKPLNYMGEPDVFAHKRVTGGYPTEKPFALIEELILNSSQEGDLVFDPFMGGGTTAAVCKQHNRDCVTLDILPRALEYTRNRLDGIIPLAPLPKPLQPLEEKLLI